MFELDLNKYVGMSGREFQAEEQHKQRLRDEKT